tara:strand:+ start:137009 stop:139282 length:2274 start_codon:yes stop_codon:yes gene_type:complete
MFNTDRKNPTLKPKKLSLRKPYLATSKTALALTIPGLLVVPLGSAEEVYELDTLQIEERTVDTNPYAEKGAPYKAKISGDKRHVEEIADTPQTITVLTQTLIQDAGKTGLADILASQPGITLGTGENGNAFGDRYVIRGHEARSDVFVDSLRDPGMTIRESFDVEQIEITKGPSSTFAGRGSTGGAINVISKQASSEYDFTKLQGGLGTDDYQRYTVDTNQRINDDWAVRANLLYADEEVPDRSPAKRERTGAALSGVWQASDRMQILADYYYLDAKDRPDLGTYIDRSTGKVVKNIPVYLQEQDFLKSEVNTFTLRVGYEFAENVRLDNAMRYGTTDNGYVATGLREDSLSTHQGWQNVDYFANMANLYWDVDIAGLEHQLLFSVEYTSNDVKNGVYDVDNTGATNCVTSGRGGERPGYCIINGDGTPVANLNHLMGRVINKGRWDSDYNIDTWSVAVMDTIDFNDHWSLFLGVRADNFDYSNDLLGSSDAAPTNYSYSDTLWNGHAGLVYNINENANFYLTYSSASNINGGESDVGGNCGYGGICGDSDIIGDSKPEQTDNIELGTKWQVFDDKLLLTAAVFEITKDDVMEGADYDTVGTLNTGRNRVKGVEVSMAGNITEKLSLQVDAAFMKAKVLKSINPENEGNTLANFADDSLFAQLRYQLTDKFAFGATTTYSSKVFTGQPDTAANEDFSVPSYTVFDAFATYTFSEQLSVRLNVGNVTDEDFYYTAYRSGAFTYMGDKRNAQLTVAYEF